MRRPIFLVLGILELVVAIVLMELGCELPRTADVERSFHSAERVTVRVEVAANDGVTDGIQGVLAGAVWNIRARAMFGIVG